ncbi:MAG: UDP-N-acetyl-D-mannosamine dehydrogenase [Anaerolineales bacterium]|nr:UDP-N-acetyl-D-mannosamine dehydrogenase [Anaerolineales bacterium]
MNFNTLCVIGLGYIGLPTASTFAARGLRVLGVDINPRIIETLRRGDVHIHEPGLREEFQSALQTGRLTFDLQPGEADAFIIAVPTPFHEGELGEANGVQFKKADMRAVTSAAKSIVPYLRKGNLVVLESTSPPRTTVDLVRPILERSGLMAGRDFHLAYSPERVLPGQIMRELIENARVIGGITPESAEAGRALYAAFVQGQIIQTDATTAEMVKLMENTTRDVNIALANEFSRLAARFGVDVWEAISIASLHPRVKILSPGPGVGGHCISVDPWFFVESAPDITSLIYHARGVNDEQPRFVVELVRAALGSLKGRKIAALGLAYKPDVDDLRESPAAKVVYLLQNEGARVKTFEPFKPDGLPNMDCVPTLEAALQGAEAVILLVNHTRLRALTPETLRLLTPAKILVDAVNGWAGKDWQSAGFTFHRLGVGK